MKAKLYLRNRGDGDYFLEARTENSASVVASLNPDDFSEQKLSLKNCQAIDRGYDLDEIKRKLFGGFDGQPDSFTIAAVERTVEIMFEILSDKKFSEEDVLKAIEMYYEKKKIFIEIIQSLQQTEWDVEIEMVKEEYIWSPPGEGFEDQTYRDWREVPKLDVDGCLILKKI